MGWRSVTPTYFSALGIPLLRGRAFTEEDRTAGPNAIILNQALAQRLFPGKDPLGKIIRFHLEEQRFTEAFTVIGVTANTQNQGLGGRVGPEYYMVRRHAADDLIFRYLDSQRVSIVARSGVEAQAVGRELSDAVASLDPTTPVQLATLSQTVYKLAQRPRFSAALLLLFAAMGLLLAAAGIYGLVSLLVSQRTQEIAIHIALGANPVTMSRRMVLQASAWIVLGAAVGIFCSLAIARWVSALLFGIKPNDPFTLAESVLALLGMGIIAAYVPARRAARIDPMVALRYE